MDIVVLIFLCSGLFLGWSLGANDAANVFGTAVGTRMIKFGTAALICAVFVALGAVLSGAGASHTLGKLGAVNALGGSFMAAFAAAFTVYVMTRLGLPVSTSQAIVGAIIGWNLFSGFPTDTAALTKIVGTWIACPLLAGVIGVVLFKVTTAVVRWGKIHIVRLDSWTRIGLILAGAFGSYALGANNIANVMGVFVASNPFTSFNVAGIFNFTGIQQLFLLGAAAIAVGIFTYSKRVMLTVGGDLLPLSPVAAWVVVVSHSIVLFLFASRGLEHTLASAGLPTIPLVPVSSSQAVIGAVIGIGLLKGGRGIKWGVLLNISSGWVTTPIVSCLMCFIGLFVLQNVFNQQVYRDASYVISTSVMERLEKDGVATDRLEKLKDQRFDKVREFRSVLADVADFTSDEEAAILDRGKIDYVIVDNSKLWRLEELVSDQQFGVLWPLVGRSYLHPWMLAEDLAEKSDAWKSRPETKANKLFNRRLEQQRHEVYDLFRRPEPRKE
ncbi:MAG: inorganic phosphate transporter [Hyphomicrobiales bacterium]|nr:inorganic phosphate transporter [Hyphomicrobiales bacterium]